MPHLEAVAKNGTMVPRRVFFSKSFPRGLCKIVRSSAARCVCSQGGSFGGTRSTPTKRPQHNPSTCAGLRAPGSIHTDCKNLPPRRPHSFCYHCLLVSGSAVDILYPKHCWFLNSSFPASGCLQLIHLNYVDINIYAYGKGLFHVSLKHCTFWTSSFYQNK